MVPAVALALAMLPVSTHPAADGTPVRLAPQVQELQSLGCADALFERLVPCQPFGPAGPVVAMPAETMADAGPSASAGRRRPAARPAASSNW